MNNNAESIIVYTTPNTHKIPIYISWHGTGRWVLGAESNTHIKGAADFCCYKVGIKNMKNCIIKNMCGRVLAIMQKKAVPQ